MLCMAPKIGMSSLTDIMLAQLETLFSGLALVARELTAFRWATRKLLVVEAAVQQPRHTGQRRRPHLSITIQVASIRPTKIITHSAALNRS